MIPHKQVNGKPTDWEEVIWAMAPRCNALADEDTMLARAAQKGAWRPYGVTWHYTRIDDIYCWEIAVWRATWSDREMTVCQAHRQNAQENFDGDHEYDKTGGLDWEELTTGRTALQALGTAKTQGYPCNSIT